MAQMGDTRARTEQNYANSKLTDEEQKFFAGATGVKHVMMLAENWCGDVHRNSPLIAHIVEAIPGAELRVFFRDQVPDLRDTFLNNGYQSIPVVVFFDKDWNEIGRWMERAHGATGAATGIRARTLAAGPPGAAAGAGAPGRFQGPAERGDERVPQAGRGRVRQAGWGALARRRGGGEAPARSPRQEVAGDPCAHGGLDDGQARHVHHAVPPSGPR